MSRGLAVEGLLLILSAVAPDVTRALDLELPGNAAMTTEIREPATTYFLPLAPWQMGEIPTVELEGALVQQAWQIEAQGLTSLQMMTPLRQQVIDAGYDILFDCAGQECGGFDFRFNTRVIPAPDMFVDLFDFRFLSARWSPDAGPSDYITLLVSRAGGTGYVQITQIRQNGTQPGQTLTVQPGAQETRPVPSSEPGSLAEALTGQGHVVLRDLEFETGSASLGAGPYASLEALARFLRADSTRRVALVGHTDTVGGLEPNVGLSRRRATSVLERLATQYDIPRQQLEAGGMGYLSPLTTNLTPEGREANRRVEAVLLNTE